MCNRVYKIDIMDIYNGSLKLRDTHKIKYIYKNLNNLDYFYYTHIILYQRS